ncbi:MAG TPA: transposase [Candidatus Coprocola pullicola]|nr:transposase [Candidatus Coprocola pullicola]
MWISIVYGIQNDITNIIFVTKYRRKMFYYQKRKTIVEILRKLCERKGMKSRSMCIYVYR